MPSIYLPYFTYFPFMPVIIALEQSMVGFSKSKDLLLSYKMTHIFYIFDMLQLELCIIY